MKCGRTAVWAVILSAVLLGGCGNAPRHDQTGLAGDTAQVTAGGQPPAGGSAPGVTQPGGAPPGETSQAGAPPRGGVPVAPLGGSTNDVPGVPLQPKPQQVITSPLDLGEFDYGGGTLVSTVHSILVQRARNACGSDDCVAIAEQKDDSAVAPECNPGESGMVFTRSDPAPADGRLMVTFAAGAKPRVTIFGVECVPVSVGPGGTTGPTRIPPTTTSQPPVTTKPATTTTKPAPTAVTPSK